MSDKKPESWGSSFDHVVFGGIRTGARRLQADREAKFENKYGRSRPHEQQPQHPGGASALYTGKDGATGGEDSPPVELVEDDASPQREEHDETVELLQDIAQELENQQLDQQQQDLELPTNNDQHSDEGGSSGARTPPGSPPLPSPPRVETDDEDMAGTKIGIPKKFTGQETDVSNKARDWHTGLHTYFTEKSIAACEWERRCCLIRWSLVTDSIPDGQDSTSALSWFKGIMKQRQEAALAGTLGANDETDPDDGGAGDKRQGDPMWRAGGDMWNIDQRGDRRGGEEGTSSQASEGGSEASTPDGDRVKFYIGSDEEDDAGEWTTTWRRKGWASMRGALGARRGIVAPAQAAGGRGPEERRFVDGGGQRGGPVGQQAGRHGGEDQGARG